MVGLNGDPISTKNLQGLWREVVLGGTAMVAFEMAGGQKPKLIGVNMTIVSSRDHEENKVRI